MASASNNSCIEGLVTSEGFTYALQAAVTFTSFLSILGAGLIVFTYVAFRDLRTVARHLLLQLSVADIIVASSHIVGVNVIYPKYADYRNCGEPKNITDVVCEIQGGFTMVGTLGSFLWTIAIAVYLVVIAVFEKPKLGRNLRWVFYLMCWGIPIVLAVSFGISDRLGLEQHPDFAWCYMKPRGKATALFGYELWAYLVYITLPVLYVWIRCYVKIKMTRVQGRISVELQSKAKSADLKLIFVPLLFLLCRMWGAILSIPLYYIPISRRNDFLETQANAVLVIFAGVGSSAQGLVNGILFCFFTQVVRKRLLNLVRCRSSRNKASLLPLHPTSEQLDDTQRFEATTDYSQDEGENPVLPVINEDPKQPLLSGTFSRSNYHSLSASKRAPGGFE